MEQIEDQAAERLKSYLAASLAGRTNVDLRWAWQPPISARRWPDAANLAKALASDVDFCALGLGTWLGTPDGEFFAGVAERLLPRPYSPAAEVIVDALQIAAEQQTTQGRRVVLGSALVGIAAVLVIWALARNHD